MIILASASPRRKELLSYLVDDFTVVVSDADETTDISDAEEMVLYLATLKAKEVAKKYDSDIVIGADTVVEINGEILGKPVDKADAIRMINMLKNNTHSVYTGVCIAKDGVFNGEVCRTKVTFCDMSEQEIKNYVDNEDVLDKAGAYGIQGGAAKFVRKIDGCYYNVMGLPISVVYKMLNSENR